MMKFSEWVNISDSLDWVTKSEILLNRGLIPCGGCESYRNYQGIDFRLCPFCKNLASDCLRNGRAKQAHLCTGRKQKDEGCDHLRTQTGNRHAKAPCSAEGGTRCLTDSKFSQLCF